MARKMELIVDGEKMVVEKIECVDFGIEITSSLSDLRIEAVEGQKLVVKAIDKNAIGVGAHYEE